jgi:hypothetical protein
MRVMPATMLPSHAGDGTVEVTWPRRDVDVESCWRQCYQVMLATMLPRRLGRDTMLMPNHAGDNAAESC